MLVVTVTARERTCSSVFIASRPQCCPPSLVGPLILAANKDLGRGAPHSCHTPQPPSLFVLHNHNTTPVNPASNGPAVFALSYSAWAQVSMEVWQRRLLPVPLSCRLSALQVALDLPVAPLWRE